MIIRKPRYLSFIDTPTNLKKLQTFSWHSNILAFLALKNKLISFHNLVKPSFPNLLSPSTKKCKHLQQLSLIVIPSVKWCTQKKHKKDEAKFKNASKSMHFQIPLHHFSFITIAICFLLFPMFFNTPMFYTNMRFSHLFFHTLQITLFCSHCVPIKFQRDFHKAQTQSSRCFQQDHIFIPCALIKAEHSCI